jgi:hypothetical protein
MIFLSDAQTNEIAYVAKPLAPGERMEFMAETVRNAARVPR